MADLQCGIVVNEWSLKIIHSHPVDTALLAIQFNTVQVHHCWKDGQLHITLFRENECVLIYILYAHTYIHTHTHIYIHIYIY